MAKMRRVYFEISRDLWPSVEAALEDCTQRDLLETAIEEELARRAREGDPGMHMLQTKIDAALFERLDGARFSRESMKSAVQASLRRYLEDPPARADSRQ